MIPAILRCIGLVLVFVFNVHGGFTTTSIGPKPIWNATSTDRLRHDLLLNYDKFSRPAQPFNATTVKFGITLVHIDVVEVKSSFTVHCYVRLQWRDEKLIWNATDYENITSVHLADHEIWQPDIFVYNSATAQAINSYGNTHTIVDNNGGVIWVPPTQFTVLCNINLRYWPFDQQICSLRFGSWTYHGEQINLVLYDNKTKDLDTTYLFGNNEWKIVGWTVERNLKYYSCCAEAYPDITMNITVNRISPSYNAIVITPAFAVIFLTLMTFWLPPQAGEKIILQGCTAIIICMFLLYFTQKLPAMGSNTPLIVLFYSTSLYVVCFSLMSSVLVIWLSRTPHTLHLSWKIKQMLIGWLGKGLCLSHYIAQTNINTHRVTAEEMREHQGNNDLDDRDHQLMDDDRRIIDTNTSQASQQDWILLGAAIDRLSFYFYSLLFAIMAIAYSL